ncbi:hypothetical protein BDZ45DRAFT_698351 [Acephala macrosclerotiorum]|nr:hypothetical protein BDZ45DRAFT_698351 [Acephala macrosclerotiorum]
MKESSSTRNTEFPSAKSSRTRLVQSEIFTALTRGESQIKANDLLSWVPNWSAVPKTESLYVRAPHQAPKTFEKSIFHACGGCIYASRKVEGANAGGNEPIFQDEVAQGLAGWRLRELVQTYNDALLKLRADANDYPPEEYEEQLDMRVLAAYRRAAWNRKAFLTEKDVLSLAPMSARKGDSVCILHGSITPVVLKGDNRWQVIGQCYVEGAMKGKAELFLKAAACASSGPTSRASTNYGKDKRAFASLSIFYPRG